jgi:hypothetical protein
MESELYAKSVPIQRIYHHPQGFIILYQKQNREPHRIFVPYIWFQVPREHEGARWRAEVVYGSRQEAPFMHIFWDRNGFSHVRLFLQESRTHQSWGMLLNPNRFDDSFDIEEPDFQF